MTKILSLTLWMLLMSVQLFAKNKPKDLKTKALNIVSIAPNVWMHTSYLKTNDFGTVPCNGMIVVDGKEALILDTPVDDSVSNELIKFVRQTLGTEIIGVVATHFHTDCLGGLKAFHQHHIPSYANQMTIKIATTKGLVVPQNGFTDIKKIKVGNTVVDLRYFGEGHTKDNIVAYFPKQSILFGGCLIKEKGAGKGNMEDANAQAWPHTVTKIKQAYPNIKTIIPGHGKVGNKSLLDYTIALFK